MACYFLFPCYLSSSSCFLFSPLFLLLAIPCSPLPPLHLVVLPFSSKLHVLSWAGTTLDFAMKCSVTGHIAFMQKRFNWNLKCTYQLKTKCGHIKTEKAGKDEVLNFSYFLPKVFLHMYLKLRHFRVGFVRLTF